MLFRDDHTDACNWGEDRRGRVTARMKDMDSDYNIYFCKDDRDLGKDLLEKLKRDGMDGNVFRKKTGGWTMMTKFQTMSGALLGAVLCVGICEGGSEVPSYLADYKESYAENPREAALEWFSEAEFGMFIHYGLYSLAEGYWGDIHSKPAEWVQLRAKIRPDEYAQLADKFTAEKFDADFITDLAVAAGMKYINITTRHHDGFCLFDSKYTDFKSTNSAAKRDLVAELAEQCHKKGLGIFFYYSHGRDWKHPHAPNRDEWKGNPRPAYNPMEESYKYGEEHDLQLYVEYMKNQITELLTNYGPVAGIWLDGRAVPNSTPGLRPELKIQELYDHIHSLQPQVLVSYKQGVLGTEDFKAPERHFKGESDVPLEICNTMQPYAWGYDRDNDVGHKTPDAVMKMLSGTKEMKANLLLNIGPLPNGSVFPDDITTLREVGKRRKK